MIMQTGQAGNIEWSREIYSLLHDEGVRDIVFCPGARNGPLVAMLAQTSGFDCHSFFEEREAGFYAIGLARRKGQPVAVITTSGTAAAELLPSVIEAFHTGVPLILLTADRPRRLRGTGAPQAIDQTGLFGKFLGLEFDLANGAPFSLEKWNRRSPVHLNICFDEPLIDAPIEPLELAPKVARPSYFGRSDFAVTSGEEWAVLRLTRFLRAEGALVVVVGTLETDEEREAVSRFLLRLGAPAYLESTSGLRERAELREIALRAGDQVLTWGLKRGLYQKVLRIGGVPTVRVWRDLDDEACKVELFSLTPLPFAGLSRGEMICASLAPVMNLVGANPATSALAGALIMKDRAVEPRLLELYARQPLAEPSMVHQLSKLLTANSLVYVGNSLPIREWDLAAAHDHARVVEANRGVNGIDGQLATFFGLAREHAENWAIIGDLTALYSLASPWALFSRERLRAKIVIINNSGGQIFSRIYSSKMFLNQHALDFKHWAGMWGLGYQRWTEIPTKIEYDAAAVEVIEVIPDAQATQTFWQTYDGLWT